MVINSAPTEGVRVTPLSQIRSLFAFLDNPANRHKAVGFTPEQFHYAFTNSLNGDDSAKVYERYHIPAPGSWVWSCGLLASFTPGRQETWVDYSNDARAPLLFITRPRVVKPVLITLWIRSLSFFGRPSVTCLVSPVRM